MSSSRATSEYHLLPVEELLQHPEPMMDVRVSTPVRAEHSPERGGMRGERGVWDAPERAAGMCRLLVCA